MTITSLTVLLQAPAQNPLMSFLPLLLIIVVFYFFMIRPQMKKQKEVKEYRSSLQKGDKVITIGGVYGTITEVSEATVILEISTGVKVKVDKNGLLKDSSDLLQK